MSIGSHMQNFSQFWRIVSEIVLAIPCSPKLENHNPWARPGPSPTARIFPERIEIPAPSKSVGALWRYLAYVVEGHASACPQTVGVGRSVWCLILPWFVYFSLKWYSSGWHLWTGFRSLSWTNVFLLTNWLEGKISRERRKQNSTIFRFQNR